MWQPVVGQQGAQGAHRPAAVPSMSIGGSLGADNVLVLDEPSMN